LVYLCSCIYSQAALAFLVNISVVGQGSQRVNIQLCELQIPLVFTLNPPLNLPQFKFFPHLAFNFNDPKPRNSLLNDRYLRSFSVSVQICSFQKKPQMVVLLFVLEFVWNYSCYLCFQVYQPTDPVQSRAAGSSEKYSARNITSITLHNIWSARHWKNCDSCGIHFTGKVHVK
jgi:hypothetical protein